MYRSSRKYSTSSVLLVGREIWKQFEGTGKLPVLTGRTGLGNFIDLLTLYSLDTQGNTITHLANWLKSMLLWDIYECYALAEHYKHGLDAMLYEVADFDIEYEYIESVRRFSTGDVVLVVKTREDENDRNHYERRRRLSFG